MFEVQTRVFIQGLASFLEVISDYLDYDVHLVLPDGLIKGGRRLGVNHTTSITLGIPGYASEASQHQGSQTCIAYVNVDVGFSHCESNPFCFSSPDADSVVCDDCGHKFHKNCTQQPYKAIPVSPYQCCKRKRIPEMCDL